MESELFGYEKGAFTGRGGGQAGAVRAGPRRDAVPRRDRRDPGGDAGEAAAGAAGVGVRAGGRHQDHQGGRAAGDRHQPRPGGGAGHRRLPRGPVLPAERGAHPPAAAARSARGHPAAGRALHHQVQRSPAQGDHPHRAGGGGAAGVVQLAGQHPRAGERHRADHAVLRGQRHPPGEPAHRPAGRHGRRGRSGVGPAVGPDAPAPPPARATCPRSPPRCRPGRPRRWAR